MLVRQEVDAQRQTLNVWSKSAQAQLRWMTSKTALPGGKNAAFARLLVWVETKIPVLAMTLSCSLKGVEAPNSTTCTWCRI